MRQTANFNIFNRPLLIFACLYPHIWKSGGTNFFPSLRSRILFCTPTLKSVAPPMVITLRSHSRGAEVLPVPRNPLARQEVLLQEMKTWGTIPLDRISPDRNRKYTPTTQITLPILPRLVRVSILHRQKTTLMPPIHKFSVD